MSESLELQVAKYETLSRIRGTRVAELEDVVIKLNGALRESEKRSNEATEELRDAMAFIDNLVAENKLLKQENATIADLRRKLDHEREISQRLDTVLNPRKQSLVKKTIGDIPDMYVNQYEEKVIKMNACTQTEFFPLLLSKYSQTDDASKFVACRE